MLEDNQEPILQANDANLSARARELIRIGEIGIAREDQAALAKFFHPEFRFHGPEEATLTREQLWDYFAACRAAFDDFSVTRQQIFSDGEDYVAARTTFLGIFARPFTASPLGTIQPHGNRVFYKINNVFRYAADGSLIEEWAQYDSRLFLHRLGVDLVPGPRASTGSPSAREGRARL
jgi:predicted ester cyclase